MTHWACLLLLAFPAAFFLLACCVASKKEPTMDIFGGGSSSGTSVSQCRGRYSRDRANNPGSTLPPPITFGGGTEGRVAGCITHMERPETPPTIYGSKGKEAQAATDRRENTTL